MISEVVQVKKPDPRLFAWALDELGCQGAEARFVRDHPVHDVLGVRLPWGSGPFGCVGSTPGP